MCLCVLKILFILIKDPYAYSMIMDIYNMYSILKTLYQIIRRNNFNKVTNNF